MISLPQIISKLFGFNIVLGRTAIPTSAAFITVTADARVRGTVTAGSFIFAMPQLIDANVTKWAITDQANGTFRITANAAPAASQPYVYVIFNPTA